jgi:hypothetical protein
MKIKVYSNVSKYCKQKFPLFTARITEVRVVFDTWNRETQEQNDELPDRNY